MSLLYKGPYLDISNIIQLGQRRLTATKSMTS
jgi:hypothetical protein